MSIMRKFLTPKRVKTRPYTQYQSHVGGCCGGYKISQKVLRIFYFLVTNVSSWILENYPCIGYKAPMNLTPGLASNNTNQDWYNKIY